MVNVSAISNRERHTLESTANYPDVRDGTAIVTAMGFATFRTRNVSAIRAGPEMIVLMLTARVLHHVQDTETVAMKFQDVAIVMKNGQVTNIKSELFSVCLFYRYNNVVYGWLMIESYFYIDRREKLFLGLRFKQF